MTKRMTCNLCHQSILRKSIQKSHSNFARYCFCYCLCAGSRRSFVCGTLGGWWKASSKLSKNDVIDECSEAATALLVLSVSEFCCTLPSPSFQKKQICLTLWPLYCSVTLKEADAQPHISVEAKEKRRVTKTKEMS